MGLTDSLEAKSFSLKSQPDFYLISENHVPATMDSGAMENSALA